VSPSLNEWVHASEFLKQTRAAGKVIHGTSTIARVSSGGVFLDRTFSCATVCKRHVNTSFSVNMKVVEIEEIAV